MSSMAIDVTNQEKKFQIGDKVRVIAHGYYAITDFGSEGIVTHSNINTSTINFYKISYYERNKQSTFSTFERDGYECFSDIYNKHLLLIGKNWTTDTAVLKYKYQKERGINEKSEKVGHKK